MRRVKRLRRAHPQLSDLAAVTAAHPIRRPARILRHAGYRASQRLRKRVEEIFDWGNDGRPMRKMKVRGLANVSFIASLTVGCYALLERTAK